MDPLLQARTLARYNRWMNERLYDCCERIPDAVRKEDSGAFFKSIHGTLNHLLVADRIWMGRFVGPEYRPATLDHELYADFAQLRAAREAMDEAVVADLPARDRSGRDRPHVAAARSPNFEKVVGFEPRGGRISRTEETPMVTIKQARKIAKSMPQAEEREHHGHPDFRVNGKIFATLWPDESRAVVKLKIPDQMALIQMDPETFSLNGWSRQGYINVDLRQIDVSRLRTVMESAWSNVAAKAPEKAES